MIEMKDVKQTEQRKKPEKKTSHNIKTSDKKKQDSKI